MRPFDSKFYQQKKETHITRSIPGYYDHRELLTLAKIAQAILLYLISCDLSQGGATTHDEYNRQYTGKARGTRDNNHHYDDPLVCDLNPFKNRQFS